MTRRGDGIGLEVTTSVVRGVRLDQDEPGRVVAAAEAPISRFDDEAAVLDALVRVHGQLGDVAGIHAATTRAAWFPVGSTMQRLDATGHTGPELNTMRHELAERAGITSTMLIESQARRWMLVLRWDHIAASRLERLLERAGFVDASVEPAPVAFGRVVGIGDTGGATRRIQRSFLGGGLRRRRADRGHQRAPGVTRVPGHGGRRPRSTRCIASTTCSARRSWPTSSTRSPPPRSRPRGGPASSTCNSCSPMFRIPRSPPTTCALRSAKPWRSVPPLERPAWPGGSDRSTSSPRPAPPRTADTRRPWAIERIVELPPRVRAQPPAVVAAIRPSGSVAVEEAGPFAEDGDRLAQRHQVTALTTFGVGAGVRRQRPRPLELRPEAGVLGLERHHALDAFEVQALIGELGDAPQDLDVVVAVAPVAALCPGGSTSPRRS